MNELALFAGAGGGILAGKELGWRTICGVERDAYAAGVLAQRQNDGSLAPFPIWSDVTTFDGTRWRGRVDVISGGFPCQDISCAGAGAGIDGARSGMWVEMARIIREVGPWVVFVENSPMLTSRGLGRVLGDLAEMGFNAEWGVLGAWDVGANHQRDRIWIVAYSNSLRRREAENLGPWGENQTQLGNDGQEESLAYAHEVVSGQGSHRQSEGEKYSSGCEAELGNPDQAVLQEREILARSKEDKRPAVKREATKRDDWWAVEPNVGRVVNELAFRVDRLKAIGNGQVPKCAAEAFRQLMNRIDTLTN